MGRRRKAWLWGGSGVRIERGRRLPGYYVRFSDYSTGTRVNRSLHFASRKAATDWVRRYNAAIDLRLLGEVVPVPMRQAAIEYLKAGEWAPETARQYGISLGILRNHVGDRPVHQIGHDDIVAAFETAPSRATKAKHARAVHAFFRWAINRGYANVNPAEHAHRGQFKRERPTVSEEQLAGLVKLEGDPIRRLAMAIAMSTGLDRGKIERLTPENIDRDTWSIRAIRPKTGGANVIPLPHVLIPHVAKRLAETPPLQPLLPGIARERFERDWFSVLREKAGLPRLLFRDLRAVASSRLQRVGGASTQDAQHLLGHASIQTTAAHYPMPDPELQRRLRELPLPGYPVSEELTR